MSFARYAAVVVTLILCAGFAFAAQEPTPASSLETDKLKQHMPEKIAGLKRGEINAQKMSTEGAVMNIVDASYINPDDVSEQPPSADLTICNYGSNSPVAEAAASWSKSDFSRESDNEYEKTVKIQGFPALESYNKQDKFGTMTIFVDGRILVTLNVTNVPIEKMREEANALPLKKLAELK